MKNILDLFKNDLSVVLGVGVVALVLVNIGTQAQFARYDVNSFNETAAFVEKKIPQVASCMDCDCLQLGLNQIGQFNRYQAYGYTRPYGGSGYGYAPSYGTYGGYGYEGPYSGYSGYAPSYGTYGGYQNGYSTSLSALRNVFEEQNRRFGCFLDEEVRSAFGIEKR